MKSNLSPKGLSSPPEFIPKHKICSRDLEFLEEMMKTNEMFVITDPSLPDHPIVYASKAFLVYTGFRVNEIVGRNCRFLQGRRTDESDTSKIRQALMSGDDINLRIINYKSNGDEVSATQFRELGPSARSCLTDDSDPISRLVFESILHDDSSGKSSILYGRGKNSLFHGRPMPR